MAFKSSNDLRVEVRYNRGQMVARAWRGDTEIQVKEMVQTDGELDFTADLGAEVAVPIAPLPADELAASLLTPEEKEAIHQKGIDAKKAAELVTVEPLSVEGIANTKKGK